MTPRALAALACLLTAALLLGACRPPEPRGAGDGAAQVDILLLEGARLGQAPVRVSLLEGDEPVTGASVRVTGDMTHAGMVPVIRQAEETAPGDYLADDFEFSMAGDWILTVDVTLPGGCRQMNELRVNVPGRP